VRPLPSHPSWGEGAGILPISELGRCKVRMDTRIPSSFRDPSGFLFLHDGLILRQVNASYGDDYDHLMDSGLYLRLVESGLLIPHVEVDRALAVSEEAYRIVQPEVIPFISYPYEWSFTQLKQAALCTLQIQRNALEFGMSLKDCSAYNIQFRKGKPVLIDTLSFEKVVEGHPWVAYRQFCQHFLAPLALMSLVDVRLSQLLRVHVDGIPLDLASGLLPLRSKLRFTLLSHIHLHAKSQKHFSDKVVNPGSRSMSRRAFLGLIDNLESGIKALSWKPQDTPWSNYYASTNYDSDAFQQKTQLVSEILDRITPRPRTLWDLGANDGFFSRIASDRGIMTLAFDMDASCVERNYCECLERGETQLLPLLLDLTNPSPDLGWANQERMSFLQRGPTDVVLALALIHHLAIANNVTLPQIGNFFARLSRTLIIEFVPKTDSQVRRLLSTREDIFPGYTQEGFEEEFSRHFLIRRAERIRQTERTLYWMEKRE
jgi:ribosomal protein L11 methylase PrmA